MDEQEELRELVKSIRNRCVAFLYLEELIDRSVFKTIMPTLCEDILMDAQAIVLEHCKKMKGEGE